MPFVAKFLAFDSVAVMFSPSHQEIISSLDEVIREDYSSNNLLADMNMYCIFTLAAGKILKSFTDYFFSCFHQLDIENEVNNEMANRMSLFYAEATPMLKTLSNATTHFVSEVCKGGERSNTDILDFSFTRYFTEHCLFLTITEQNVTN